MRMSLSMQMRKRTSVLVASVACFIVASLGSVSCTRHETSGGSQQAVAGVEKGCEHDAHTLRCVKYLQNYDGDTITFNVPNVHPLLGEKISVRVNGLDTPEVKTKDECEKQSARIARNLVESKLKNAKRIDLLKIDRDKYFRILADVQVDNTDLKAILLRNGLAYEYHGGTKKKVDWCSVARGEARQVLDRSPASR